MPTIPEPAILDLLPPEEKIRAAIDGRAAELNELRRLLRWRLRSERRTRERQAAASGQAEAK
jgi:plasmid stability protein